MELRIDKTKAYGLVLEGGGAKGAYQIGAWRALREAGIRIRGVAGASVGALNGAMICMNDLEKAEYLWENISYSKVMDVDDELMERLRKGRLRSEHVKKILNEGFRFLREGGVDVTPLRCLIEATVDEDKIRRSPCDLYVVTYSLTDRKKIYVNLKETEPGMMKDMLLASAYFLAFKNEPLHGKKYADGGGVNNVPVDILVEKGYENIIVVRIYGLGRDTEKTLRIPQGTQVYHIAPRQDLGGILEFDRKKCKRNMQLGYLDAKRMIYGLEGRYYYLDAPCTESAYARRLFARNEIVRLWMQKHGFPEEEAVAGKSMRCDAEEIFPESAKELKLKEDWNYKDLYLAMLEEMARVYHVPRLHIYTLKTLKHEILVRVQAQQIKEYQTFQAMNPQKDKKAVWRGKIGAVKKTCAANKARKRQNG